MTLNDDTALLLAHLDALGVHGAAPVDRGWDHVGAIVVDASLQRRQSYAKTVRPRVRGLIAAWPDASTTSGLRRRLDQSDLAAVIRWPAGERTDEIEALTSALEDLGIETVGELRAALSDDEQRPAVRSRLRQVKHAGPKTLDYFDVLVGLGRAVAIDSRIRAVARSAGIDDLSYDHLAAVVAHAASQRGWRPGDLDAALWRIGQDGAVAER